MIQSVPCLQLQNVERSFSSPRGPVTVLRRVNISILPGEFVIITGPSGSGKTTLLNLTALIDRPTIGTVLFEGENTADMEENRLCRLRGRGIGMVFQQFHLLSRRSAFQNVLFRFRYLDTEPEEAEGLATSALANLGLAHVAHQEARLLSAGEMQRVAIARAVASKPRVLVADEPTGNLDSAATRHVMESLQRLNHDGITILLVTHDETLLNYASHHLMCHDGNITDAKES